MFKTVIDNVCGLLIAGTADEYLVDLQNDLCVVRRLDPDCESRHDQPQRKKAAEDRTHKDNDLKMYMDLRAVGIVYIARYLLHCIPLTENSVAPGNPSHAQLGLRTNSWGTRNGSEGKALTHYLGCGFYVSKNKGRMAGGKHKVIIIVSFLLSTLF
jgi:hypothetical protein